MPAPLVEPHEPVPAGTVPGLAEALAHLAAEGVTGRCAIAWAADLDIIKDQ
jgi:hypothetical protein